MKFAFIEQHASTWPVNVMCRMLGVSRSGYYGWRDRSPSARTTAHLALLDDVRRIQQRHQGRYGSPRMHAALRAEGHWCSRGRVERLMRRHRIRALAGRRFRPCTTDSRHHLPIAPNLLAQRFAAPAPNRVWLADITYIATGEGWLYLAAVLDLATRKIVGWAMRDHMRTELPLAALMMAAQRQRPAPGLDLLEAALEPLLGDPSFAELKDQTARLTGLPRSARSLFLGWSTGHKIALHVVASLVAHARPRALVLFDEPEAHLHLPLMAALMHSVHIVLTEVNALCVVATHSPVLLQETLSRHIRRVRRTGKSLEMRQPALETFGENVGVLTYDAFGLTASSTDFHKVLDLLVDGRDTPEKVDVLFKPGLSAQARAYVLIQFARKA